MYSLGGCDRETYGQRDFAIVGTRLSESDVEGGFAFEFRRNHLLAFEDQIARVLDLHISAEDKVALGLVVEDVAFLFDQQASAMGLGVHAVCQGRAEATRLLGGLAREFNSEVNRVADGVGQSLEDGAEFLSDPVKVEHADIVFAFDLVPVGSLEKRFRVERSGRRVHFFVVFGS